MNFLVLENQLTLIAKEIPFREEAIEIARTQHETFPNKYHEVYRINDDGSSWGVTQWKPGDKVRRSLESSPKSDQNSETLPNSTRNEK